jgi:hypothetical protein
MKIHNCARVIFLLTLLPMVAGAQLHQDVAPLKSWPAPLFWQPTQAETQLVAKAVTFGNEVAEDTRVPQIRLCL